MYVRKSIRMIWGIAGQEASQLYLVNLIGVITGNRIMKHLEDWDEKTANKLGFGRGKICKGSY